jgi:hypothetical protein
MPIDWTFNGLRYLVTFSDPYSTPEAEAVMKAIFSQPELARSLRLLVDVRNSTPPTTEFVGNSITFWQMHVDKMWGARIAIVTGTPDQARMANVSDLTTRARELPFTIRMFDEADLVAAEVWLAE